LGTIVILAAKIGKPAELVEMGSLDLNTESAEKKREQG
jgi:hypothetical protein